MFKRQHKMMATFSMASMTDVIFLLLIFFMVTSTFVFPTALEVTLPQSSVQSAIKPGITLYIDKNQELFASVSGEEPQPLESSAMVSFLKLAVQNNPDAYIALYADENVPYGSIVRILNVGAENNFKMVLATRPAPDSVTPKTAE